MTRFTTWASLVDTRLTVHQTWKMVSWLSCLVAHRRFPITVLRQFHISAKHIIWLVALGILAPKSCPSWWDTRRMPYMKCLYSCTGIIVNRKLHLKTSSGVLKINIYADVNFRTWDRRRFLGQPTKCCGSWRHSQNNVLDREYCALELLGGISGRLNSYHE